MFFGDVFRVVYVVCVGCFQSGLRFFFLMFSEWSTLCIFDVFSVVCFVCFDVFSVVCFVYFDVFRVVCLCVFWVFSMWF